MDRRTFLAHATTATTGLISAAALPKQSYAKRSPNETVNVAVVGIRGQGKTHYSAYGRMKNVRITHVVEVDDAVSSKVIPELNARLESSGGETPNPTVIKDIRTVLDMKDVDVISIATPDHWHSLIGIWACQAGKDVYCEKPVSHNVWEGRQLVTAARQYDRITACGTQNRSIPTVQRAMKFLHDGGIGKLYAAKALCYKPRRSIGMKPDTPVPAGLDYDLWLGPAPWRAYNVNRLHYNWHWHWDTGTTDMGNQGIHQMDVMRWGMNKHTLPRTIHSIGGLYEDGGETSQNTPNTQYTTFEYDDDSILHFEVRGWYTGGEEGIKVGNLFYGSKGWMSVNSSDIQVFMGARNEPYAWDPENPDLAAQQAEREQRQAQRAEWAAARAAGRPIQRTRSGSRSRGARGPSHFDNFMSAVRAHDMQMLNADILEGHLSSSLCHLGNISHRVRRALTFDNHSESFINDDEANAYLSRRYRHPYVVPKHV